MKRIVTVALTIGATLLAIGLLWVFQPTLALFGGSLALSAALRPLVQRLESRGIKRGTAILLCYLVLLTVLALGVLTYGVGVTTELAEGADALPATYAALQTRWQQGSEVQQAIAHNMPAFDTLLRGQLRGSGLVGLSSLLLAFSTNTASVLLFGFAVLSLAYYWLLEVAHFERLWLSLLPVATRVPARNIWRNAEAVVGAYIRATVMAIVISALLLLVLYRALGLPFGTLLALLGGASQLIPRIGPVAAVLVACAVAATSLSPVPALMVAIVGIGIQYATHKFAVYLIRQNALKVNALLQVLLLLALAQLGGLWAMIYAPPLAALIQVIYAGALAIQSPTQVEANQLAALSDRLGQLRASPDAERVELASTLRRSEALLRDARALLEP